MFGRTGKIEECVKFGTGQTDFCYTIEKTSRNEFSGSFTEGRIIVRVPEKLANQWIDSEQVGIEGSQTLDELNELQFLIEKDFVCLSSHDNEDQSDKYPHPKGEEAC